MRYRLMMCLFVFSLMSVSLWADETVTVDFSSQGRVFEGVGALSAGASSRLLIDYKEPYRRQILDYLFKPKFGASFHHLKVEIGGDINSTDGSEPSHARTKDEFLNPKPAYFQRGYEWFLMNEAKQRNPDIYLDVLQWGAPYWFDGKDSFTKFFSKDNIDFIISFVRGAKTYHNLDINFVGCWKKKKKRRR